MTEQNIIDPKSLLEKLGFMALGTVVLMLPNGLYAYSGYTSPIAILLEIVSYFVGFILIVYGLTNIRSQSTDARRMVLLMTAAMAVMTALYVFYGFVAKNGITDEMYIDIYSAKSLLNGINPYGLRIPINSLISNGVPFSFLTPTMNGSFINFLGYPALSFLLLIPFIIFNINPVLLPVIFSSLLSIIVAVRYIKSSLPYAAPLATAISLINLNIIFFSLSGMNDIVWAVFLSLSIVFIGKKFTGGIFYGLSIAFKQIPFILFPFLIVYVYRTYGVKKTIYFTTMAILVFMIFNLPFIIWNPGTYVHSVLSPESSSIIGIGFGPSQLAFAGYAPFVNNYVFGVAAVVSILVTLALYYINFEKYKYVLTVIPLVFFFFNYRLLENYVLFWPIISLLMIPQMFEDYTMKKEMEVDIQKSKRTIDWTIKKPFITAFLVAILILSPATALVFSYETYHNNLSIVSVNEISTSGGNISSLSVSIDIHNNNFYYPMNFRILTGGPLFYPNGYLWNISSVKKISANIEEFFIFTNYTSQQISSGNTYILEVYSTNMSVWEEIHYSGSRLTFSAVSWY